MKEGVLGDIVRVLTTDLASGQTQHQSSEAIDQDAERGFIAARGELHEIRTGFVPRGTG